MSNNDAYYYDCEVENDHEYYPCNCIILSGTCNLQVVVSYYCRCTCSKYRTYVVLAPLINRR